VGAYRRTRTACVDITGNVWEWTRDAYTGDHASRSKNSDRDNERYE
jgi:formylglycine-generating enzyme required for sulfatase activity